VQTLKALDVLRASVPDVRLLVLTRSTAQEQGLDDPRWAGVRPHVVLGGWLEGEMLAAAYQVADVVVTPSVYLDPLISVNPEAMLAGKPVVTTCLGGAREIVEDGVTGFVVNPLHVPALADALRRVLTDPDLAARMGAAGRVRAQRLCDPRTQAEGLASHYAEAVRLNAANTR
jgi:type III pantothenate kinase